METLREKLTGVFQKYKVQPVGSGTFDCIIGLENIEEFVVELSRRSLRIIGLTWWCHTKTIPAQRSTSLRDLEECPHGMGGPISEFYEGWFSELQWDWLKFSNNEEIVPYILQEFPKSTDYLPCLVPALWIEE